MKTKAGLKALGILAQEYWKDPLLASLITHILDQTTIDDLAASRDFRKHINDIEK